MKRSICKENWNSITGDYFSLMNIYNYVEEFDINKKIEWFRVYTSENKPWWFTEKEFNTCFYTEKEYRKKKLNEIQKHHNSL